MKVVVHCEISLALLFSKELSAEEAAGITICTSASVPEDGLISEIVQFGCGHDMHSNDVFNIQDSLFKNRPAGMVVVFDNNFEDAFSLLQERDAASVCLTPIFDERPWVTLNQPSRRPPQLLMQGKSHRKG